MLQRLVALVLVGTALLSGCRTTTVATQNLDAVLSSSDSFRYQAATTTVWSDLFQTGLGAIKSVGGGKRKEVTVKKVKNPSRIALKNLRALAVSHEGDDDWRHNEQVRTFVRYATGAPSQLSRERAVLELTPHALRLGLSEPFEPPDGAANQEELREALDVLVDATGRVLEERTEVSATASADFDAAVSVLESTRLNAAGGSRLMRALGPFLKTSAFPEAQRKRLRELSLKVQREIVPEALFKSLVDREDIVRAAGMRTNTVVYGEDFAIEALFALIPRKNVSDPAARAFGRFGVPRVPIEFDETIIAVCEYFEQNGLPALAQNDDMVGLETRGTIYATLWQITINDLVFDLRTRAAAMGALHSTSGAALDTLRSEEWDGWFRELGPELEAKIRELSQAEEAASTP